MVGKIVIAATLVPMLGYTGVIVAEPLVWFIIVIPLVVAASSGCRHFGKKQQRESREMMYRWTMTNA